MKKNLLRFIIIMSLILFSSSLNLSLNAQAFSPNNVKSTIAFLASNHFKGRLAGTVENYEVSNYIKMQFIQNGLSPFEGAYYDKFDTSYPHRLDEEPFLRILDKKGALVRAYKYGVDYREEMLSFKKNYVSFSKPNVLKLSGDAIRVDKTSGGFIFFVPENNNITFRSSFMGSDPKLMNMYIMITKDTLDSIQGYMANGYSAECFIPFEVKNATLNNVTGYIKGKNSSKAPIVISSHFDHLGSDLKDTVYAGALDNASGVAFMLELCKYISSLGAPERDIIFVGFNAEEFGLLGSNHFVEKYLKKLQGAKVYNFDMIGSIDVPLGIMGSKNDSQKTNFMRSVTSTASNEKVIYNSIFEDASDHEAFRKKNIDAVTFCDSDMSKIHTPNDKLEYISTAAIERCFKVASREVIKEAFDGNILILNYKKVSGFSLTLSIILAILYIKKR
jgi:hypothetical protein